jgi:hypothetical protein
MSWAFGLRHRVMMWWDTNILEDYVASIFMVNSMSLTQKTTTRIDVFLPLYQILISISLYTVGYLS